LTIPLVFGLEGVGWPDLRFHHSRETPTLAIPIPVENDLLPTLFFPPPLKPPSTLSIPSTCSRG
jgi:hypothetical protein